jgi:AcrR family transcriptional regulator
MKNPPQPPPARGRPRDDQAHLAILKAALAEVCATGFRELTVDAIAARANVGKMTIYRRWPNKAAAVMDAFLELVGPATKFPDAPTAVESVRLQMRLQGKFFRGKYGRVIKALLGEAQFAPELADAFRERWIIPRRQMTREVLERAIREGSVRRGLDLETIVDLLYGPIYYRLQLETAPITNTFTDAIHQRVMESLHPTSTRKKKPISSRTPLSTGHRVRSLNRA